MSSEPLEAATRSGVVGAGEPLLVVGSGGADSGRLPDVAGRRRARGGGGRVSCGLGGAESDADEALCRSLCERLGVPLHVERAALGPAAGNLQARAREVRYAAAERLAE